MSERNFWSDGRLQRVGVALLIALILACVFRYHSDSDGSSALKRGDFPGIYSPAVIVAQGQAERLYDVELHRAIQARAWPSFDHEMYISVYPPFTAVLLSPLALLTPETARNVWSVVNLLCFVTALLLLQRTSVALREHFLFVATAFILYAPVLFGVLGGQNTGISMLLFVAGIQLLSRKSPKAEFIAGLLFGLWLFKPQFGCIAGLYLLASRRTRSLCGFACVAALYWCLGFAVLGSDWVTTWVRATSHFADINFSINAFQMASFAGLLSSLSHMGLFPSSAIVVTASALSLLLLLMVFFKSARSPWLLGPVLVLISPQTLFYDVSLALVACLPFLDFREDRSVTLYLFSIAGVGVLFALRDYSGLALPFLVPVFCLAFLWKREEAPLLT
ncbi:MAG: DUF2029 domain-containing protein [Deltaproteobacteria bacterium]|nr:DUF2029 domain-containing protein [Deltaproteobacteria bacterium]